MTTAIEARRSGDLKRLIRATLGLVVAVLTVLGPSPSRMALLILGAMALGALLWKIPPFELPRDGYFFQATVDRAVSATITVGAWATGFTVWGVIAGALVSGLSGGEDIERFVGTGSAWGALLGTAVGIVYWTGRRVLEDVEIIRSGARRG